jgi:hypothetical protein
VQSAVAVGVAIMGLLPGCLICELVRLPADESTFSQRCILPLEAGNVSAGVLGATARDQGRGADEFRGGIGHA